MLLFLFVGGFGKRIELIGCQMDQSDSALPSDKPKNANVGIVPFERQPEHWHVQCEGYHSTRLLVANLSYGVP